MSYISYSDIRHASKDLLEHVGVPKEDVDILIDSIIYAHRSGNGTHGISRVPIYVRRIMNGTMSAISNISIIKDYSAISLLDANNGFGQVAGVTGMETAVNKATSYGIGMVGVRHSNNFGTAGFIAKQAVKHRCVGIVCANSAPAMAPTGGFTPILGTNPIAFAFPTEDEDTPIVFDMATSVVSRGRIRLAAKNGEKIPYGWALDSSGNPTDDPFLALSGSMLPLGGHKGYGLSLVIDILAGILTGSGFAGSVRPLNIDNDISDNGHFLIALDIAKLIPWNQYLNSMLLFQQRILASGKDGMVFLPGDPRLADGFDSDYTNIKPAIVNEINDLAKRLGLTGRLISKDPFDEEIQCR